MSDSTALAAGADKGIGKQVAARRQRAGQRTDRPCAEQAQHNRVYLVTAVLPTPLVVKGPAGHRHCLFAGALILAGRPTRRPGKRPAP